MDRFDPKPAQAELSATPMDPTIIGIPPCHRWTIRIVLYWNTIPKAGIVLVLVDFFKLSNTNTKPIPTKISN